MEGRKEGKKGRMKDERTIRRKEGKKKERKERWTGGRAIEGWANFKLWRTVGKTNGRKEGMKERKTD